MSKRKWQPNSTVLKQNYNALTTLIMSRNDWTYYYDYLKQLYISGIKYEGMETTISQRYLNEVLFEQGVAILFEDDVLGNMALGAIIAPPFDPYGVGINRTAISYDGRYRKKCTPDDSAVIYANLSHKVDKDIAMRYSRILAEIDSVIATNLNVQRTPYILKSDSKDVLLTLKNMMEQIESGQNAVYAKDWSLNSLDVLDLNAPYLSDKLYELKKNYANEALTRLGIPNTAYEKKERNVTDETRQSNGATNANMTSRIMSIQEGLDIYNELKGKNYQAVPNEALYGNLGNYEAEGETGESSEMMDGDQNE